MKLVSNIRQQAVSGSQNAISDVLYFRCFLKIIYNKAEGIRVLWINLRKLKNLTQVDIAAFLCYGVFVQIYKK